MEPYDIAMLAVLVGATLFGFWKGMAWQLASLASLGASYFVALRLSPVLAPYFGSQAPLNRFIAMGAIYLGASLGVWLAFRVVAGAIDRVRLKEFDRQVGALFGAAKGVLLCVVITFFAVSFSVQARDMILHTRSGYYIALLIDRAETIMPAEIKGVIGPYLDRLDYQLDPSRHSERTAAGGFELPF
ncbi:MAG: CvpA family protein [Pirellulales bacterium]|jgi:membrane protein required for colicin V production|nr:CvpA family protein [Pirellulales bacterium]